jgi:2,5-diketo-D-gluconate reductase B
MQVIETQGMRMPKLGLGTWRMSGHACTEAVAGALHRGYRHIDTAQNYGNEAEVGAGVAASGVPRGEIFITTKVGSANLAPDALRRACDASLKALRCGIIDLYLIHWPTASMDLRATLTAMMKLREEGAIRHIGVSNFTVNLMREAIEDIHAPVVCNQVEYHAKLGQSRVLAYARSKGVAVTAYCPLGRGELGSNPVLAGIAKKHDATAAQVALKWLLEQDFVGAIPKASRPENQQANLEAFKLTLDDADRAAIAALPKNERLVNAGVRAWDAPD